MAITNNIPSGHIHDIDDINGLENELNTIKNADVKTHTHNTSDITGLSDTLSTMSSPIVKLGEVQATNATSTKLTINTGTINIFDYKQIKIFTYISTSSSMTGVGIGFDTVKSDSTGPTHNRYKLKFKNMTYSSDSVHASGPTFDLGTNFSDCYIESTLVPRQNGSDKSCEHWSRMECSVGICFSTGYMTSTTKFNTITINPTGGNTINKYTHAVVYGYK